MKQKITQVHAFGLSPAKTMQQHTQKIKDLALANDIVTHDTILLPSNVRNIRHKRAEELWMKHFSNPIIVYMWT